MVDITISDFNFNEIVEDKFPYYVVGRYFAGACPGEGGFLSDMVTVSASVPLNNGWVIGYCRAVAGRGIEVRFSKLKYPTPSPQTPPPSPSTPFNVISLIGIITIGLVGGLVLLTITRKR